MNWKTVYRDYPVNREIIWLNNCGAVPAGNHSVAAVSRFLEGYAQKGYLTDFGSFSEIRDRIKGILSSLLGCSPHELALIHNTAEGMNFISHGIRLESLDEIILLENEYPSNYYPWIHLKNKGVRIRTASLGETPADFMKNLRAVVNPRTRLISLSAVHWCTGMPLPLVDVGRLCREKDIHFIVDGAQGVGMQPLDVKQAGITAMAFSAWKWLMGPLGLGVLYINEEGLNQLDLVFMGTDSVVESQSYLPYKSRLNPTADRYTFSTPSIQDWIYFDAALEYLNDIGFEKVMKRIFQLTDYLDEGIRRIGFRTLSERFPRCPTGICVCEKTGITAEAILSHLQKHGVFAAERFERIRLSPHIYNSLSQIDRVVEILSRM